MNHSKRIHSENQKLCKDTRDIDGYQPKSLRIFNNITAIFTWLGFMGDFRLRKQKTCSLFHEFLLLQKFSYTLTQVFLKFFHLAQVEANHISLYKGCQFKWQTFLFFMYWNSPYIGVVVLKMPKQIKTPVRKIKVVPAHWLKNKASKIGSLWYSTSVVCTFTN